MNRQDVDLQGTVWIFDTFKKLTDVIQKRQVKDLLVMLRGLAAKGATIVLLAHNNKHKDDQGNSVYEGTGDVRSDVDELIFLNHIKNEDSSMTVTTKLDKVRGDFMPISFRLGKDRAVTQLDATVDVQKTMMIEKQLTQDREAIDVITDFLRDRSANQTEIFKYCAAEFALTRRAVVQVLDRYCGGGQSRWTRVKGEKNARVYTLDSRSP